MSCNLGLDEAVLHCETEYILLRFCGNDAQECILRGKTFPV